MPWSKKSLLVVTCIMPLDDRLESKPNNNQYMALFLYQLIESVGEGRMDAEGEM
jgi:hypothetical protein